MLWVDVRSEKEYSTQHKAQAINIPYKNIKRGIEKTMANKDTTIYLYCAAGVRAEKAKQSLLRAGYKNVINVGGLQNALAFSK